MNSIKNKLILLIVSALILVCAIFGVVSYTQAKKILINKTETSFLELTSEISKVVQTSMRVNIAVVETLSERRIIDDNTPWPEKLAFMEKEAKRTGFEVFAFADINGNSIRFNAARDAAKVSDRDYYIRAMQGISTYSTVFISRVTQLPSVSVAVPVKRDGKIIGVLYGIRDGNEISQLVEKIKIGEIRDNEVPMQVVGGPLYGTTTKIYFEAPEGGAHLQGLMDEFLVWFNSSKEDVLLDISGECNTFP